jgi:hypothetical protein
MARQPQARYALVGRFSHLLSITKEAGMSNDREAIIQTLNEGIVNAWDWAIVEDESHKRAARSMAEAALEYLESRGFKVVRA